MYICLLRNIYITVYCIQYSIPAFEGIALLSEWCGGVFRTMANI